MSFIHKSYEASNSSSIKIWRIWHSYLNIWKIGEAEIARLKWYREGRVPLHNLRSDIDYS